MAKKPYKLPLDVGFPALCDEIKADRTTVKQLSSTVADLAQALSDSMKEIEAALNDHPTSVPFQIPVSGWKTDELPEDDDAEVEEESTDEYPYYFDLAVDGVTSADHATVTIASSSYRTAADCGLCPVNETMDGGIIRLRSAQIPKDTIEGEYWVEDGKEME
jgi:hypothetical protein